VLEVTPTRAAIVRCFASPEVLDRLPQPAGSFPCRVAEDELLLVTSPAAGGDALAEADAYLHEADPHGLVVDHSDAFAVWTLAGPVREAWARLSENPLPEPGPDGFAFVQGALAHVSGKAVVLPGVVHLLCLSTLRHFLRERIHAACADLNPRETAPRELERQPEREAVT
jgi:hypothetical protein